jgi:hypothetical protein
MDKLNDNELAAIYFAMVDWKPKSKYGKCIQENIIEKIDNYFTPGCIFYTDIFKKESRDGK